MRKEELGVEQGHTHHFHPDTQLDVASGVKRRMSGGQTLINQAGVMDEHVHQAFGFINLLNIDD